MALHKVKNDLPESSRKAVVTLFNARLADAMDLYTQALQAHWNVRGPNFIALHELFDKIVEDTHQYADLLAERIAQLGGIARGTAAVVAKESSLKEYPLTAVRSADHVKALSSALAAFAKNMRETIDQCEEHDDMASADIATEITRAVDKYTWFVESHAVA